MQVRVPKVIICPDCSKNSIKQGYSSNGLSVIFKCSVGHKTFMKVEQFKILKEVA